ncbi:LysR family transcriptional regulator [Pseudomaricurvus alkylphenolicus]|uniref:LysR family transcriptional regulator n=1 Tax=Pseudomaricurvus alkylphenolicus TaxID=1306991 RepID=UPI00141F6B92|nr:LysR family transcriptional regulator [Pseudomaricurvus alkylphenolicus]NIB43086.1 LysR family transcriptional regulator [Pseudomaricurvus alkylphenolicus]
MRLDKVDLNLFVVFDAIYRERGVTKVAQLLHLTQPAVSNALSRLRQTFDDQLFVRTPEGMVPTPVADNVIGDVRKALALLSKSVGVNARFDPATSEKTFRLGMNDLAQSLLLPRLRQQIALDAPGVGIHSYYVDRQSAAEDLKSGALDLLLDAPEFNARELSTRRLISLPYVLAMRPDHPLAGRDITLQDYVQAQHLHVSSRKKGRGQADVALHARGEKRDITVRVHNYLVAADIALHNDLVWTVPRVMAERTGLSIKQVPFDMEPLSWNLFWSKSAGDDPANQWMRTLIKQVLDSDG